MLRSHIPIFLRKEKYGIMMSQEKKRSDNRLEPTNRKELLEIATRVERNILRFEAEMRFANQLAPPRSTNPMLYTEDKEPTIEPRKRPILERLKCQLCTSHSRTSSAN